MIYAIYKDDGPKGMCGQSMSTTCPWEHLYRLKNYDDFRAFREMVEKSTARRNPRIIAAFDDTEPEFTATGEVFDWEPKA